MSELKEEELARTILDVRIELTDRDFRTFEISALQSVQGENSAREAAAAIARALIAADYAKRDTASGLPAALEARDAAIALLRRVSDELECKGDASHYCPNCDNSLHATKPAIDAFLRSQP